MFRRPFTILPGFSFDAPDAPDAPPDGPESGSDDEDWLPGGTGAGDVAPGAKDFAIFGVIGLARPLGPERGSWTRRRLPEVALVGLAVCWLTPSFFPLSDTSLPEPDVAAPPYPN